MSDSERGLIDRRHTRANAHDPFAAPEPVVLKPTGAQVEIWLSSQQPEASPAYNEAFAIRLRGECDQQALESAIRVLPQFHEALRGRFSADGERFTMDPSIDVPIARHDLSNRAFGDREAELAQLVKHEANTPYDLRRGPLFRATLIRLEPNESVLLLSAYHGVCDGWSLDVLLMDLGRLYSAFTGKQSLPQPPQHSFRDFVSYTETPEYLANVARSRAFWLDMFKQHPPALMLPADGVRPEFRTYGATHVLQQAGAELQAAITNLARANGLSFFSVVFSAFAALLHRISGATDLVIGIPVAGHPEAGMEDCVGHLVNMVPVRCAIDPTQSFLHLCRSSSERLLDARENASVGFSEIVASLNLPRDPGRIPLVAAVFTHVQKYAPGKLVFGDCSVAYDLIARGSEAFELNLNVIEAHESLHFHSYANRDLYSQNWLTLRIREFQQLLASAVTDPFTPVGKLGIVPPDEAERIEAFNATQVEYPSQLTLVQLFEAQAGRTPDAIAVHQGAERVTYRQLDARADRLARVLRKRGVAVGTLVGLCVERTADMIAAVLAVLKAGGAYIPLDPSFPPGRLAFMVEDSALTVVVSESALAALHGAPRERVLELDSDHAEIEAEAAEPSSDGVSPGPFDPAYVLYTSGSTGKPKGVRVHHRAAVNFITSMQREPGLTSADTLLAVTTLSFDIALLELMLPLSVGARIVLATRDESRDPRSLRSLIEENGVTLLQATPATWRMLIDSGWQGSKEFRALCGGEAMQPELAEALLQRTGELWNMYGPTETTVWSTCSRVSNPRAGITIGRPIANTTVRILDSRGEACPIGVPGEICIGGDGVALGYLNRPELTAERFIQDPFSTDTDARLYKTGDLGRWRNDGQLDCLGRNDFQVKIRGYRIELGEIESTILEHGWLKEAAVVPRQAPSGEMQLIAYGIAAPGRTGDTSALWEFVGQRLPSYMVPSALVLLEAFPLTPNGKLDRKALPEPRTELGVAAAKVAPRTPIEESLGAVFREVLKLEQVGIDDNFFELGGTSLHTIHVVDRLNKRGISVPPAHMFRFPTIRRLAAEVGARHATADGEDESLGSVLVLQEGGSRPPLFLMHSMPGDLLGYGDLVHSFGPDQPVYGFHGLGSYSESIQNITDLAELYATRLMAFKPTGMLHLAGWCFGGTVAFELARVLTARGREVGFVGLLEATPTRSKLRGRAHLLKVVVTRQTVGPVSIRALLERVLRRPAEDPEGAAFALEVASGPFANRARNYARNRLAAARHRTRSYSGDVALVRAGVDSRVIVEHDYGWADFARDVDVYTAPATHESVLRLPHCVEIAQFIRDSIDRAERKRG